MKGTEFVGRDECGSGVFGDRLMWQVASRYAAVCATRDADMTEFAMARSVVRSG